MPDLRDRRYVMYGAGAGLVAYLLQRYARAKKNKKHKKRVQLALAEVNVKKKDRVAVDRVFLERLRYLIRIVLPGIRSKEFALLGLHTTFLISRTLVSIYVAKLDGSIVKAIVDRRVNTFIMLMIKWLTIAVPATYINSMIHYLESKLSIAFRSRLVDHVYSQYMAKETYYRIGNLDSRLLNPDQCLTEDVTQFCNDLAHLYSHLSKPCLDIVLMTAQLVMLGRKRSTNGKLSILPSALATLVIFGTGVILKLATPPFGKLVAEQARRYGALRAAHSRVITHAEEIAFYGGHKVEEHVLKSTYASLVKHMNYIYRTRIGYTMLEQFLMRYIWGACGMVMIAIPSFRKAAQAVEATGVTTAINGATAVASAVGTAGVAAATAVAAAAATEEEPSLSAISLTGALTASVDSDAADTVSNRTQDFVTSRGLLISAADAIERMMSSWKEITELAGRTQRIHEMISIFGDVQNGTYIKKTEKDEPTVPALPAPSPINTSNIGTTSDDDMVVVDTEAQARKAAEAEKQRIRAEIANGVGTVIDNSSSIELVDVPVVTPDGDVLIHDPGLTFTIKPHMHLLITGPNGCGKSSLFRMIGGLWPVKGGLMRKPGKGDMFYIPQRPYLTTACLREQFIYPDTTEDMRAKGLNDTDLDMILDVVYLRSVVERCGGMDSVKDWRDVLSGGEKQRVAMARLFYHKPRYAILDECTSAVSIDVEGRMYTYAKDIGITLLTVTHRPTLWKYHTHLLQFDGQGGYKFSELNADARLSLVDEKTKLEASLAGIDKAKQRLKELCSLLGESSIHVHD